MNKLPTLHDPFVFIVTTLVIFLFIMVRYVMVAGIFYGIFFIWWPNKWKQRKINQRDYTKKQLRTEIKWSTVTTLIFAIAGSVSVLLWQQGLLKVYVMVNEYPTWWLPASFIIAVVLHETYYYWLHRWMHYPKIFRIVHKVHHDSSITSPWTAFSFHPLEGLLQAVFLPLLLLVMPMHLYVLIAQLSFMTLSSVINHLNVEIYPKAFNRNIVGKWLIGATHHSLHHKQFKYNYGLYFTFWDKWKQTESPLYNDTFSDKTGTASKSCN